MNVNVVFFFIIVIMAYTNIINRELLLIIIGIAIYYEMRKTNENLRNNTDASDTSDVDVDVDAESTFENDSLSMLDTMDTMDSSASEPDLSDELDGLDDSDGFYGDGNMTPNKMAGSSVDLYNNERFDLQFDPNNTNDVKHVHEAMGCLSDNAFTNRMKYTGMQSQLAAVNRASYNAKSLKPWLEEELNENANREWWNSDHLDSKF